VRWDSPFVLAVAGTFAIHLIVVTGLDAIVIITPPRQPEPAPHVELVEIEPPPVLTPPPPPPPPPEEPVTPVVPPPAPRPQAVRAAPRPAPSAPEPPPTKTDVPVPSGGDEVVHMDNIAPSATGVAVAPGPRSNGRIGRGGTGGGTGAGSGSGTGDVARPVSIAAVKRQPQPKPGFDYLGKEYPAEAQALGIEGVIKVRLLVDEHGKVTSRLLLNKLGHGLDELAMQRAAVIEFEPAIGTDDKPVASYIVWTFRMTLPK
jgi:protein TonB